MVVNSAVLRRCRIDRNTHVDGGFIGRDDGDEPDGRVFDAACDLLTGPDGVRIRDHGPNFHLPLDAAEAADLLDAAQDEFLSVGITAVGDAQVSPREMEIYLRARHDGRLRMRVEMVMISAYLDQIAELGLVAPLGDEMLGFAGIKLYADGSLIGMTAYFPEGYTGDPAVTELSELD
jgi:predicted amidohydrolase YtcJ